MGRPPVRVFVVAVGIATFLLYTAAGIGGFLLLAWLFQWTLQVLVSILLSPVTLGVLAYSRRREYAADRRAAETTGATGSDPSAPIPVDVPSDRISRPLAPADTIRAYVDRYNSRRAPPC